MKDFSPEKFDKLGEFHNKIVELVDGSELEPPEIILILDTMSIELKQLINTKSKIVKEA